MTPTPTRRQALGGGIAAMFLAGCDPDPVPGTDDTSTTGTNPDDRVLLDAPGVQNSIDAALAGTPWEGRFDGVLGDLEQVLEGVAEVSPAAASAVATLSNDLIKPLADYVGVLETDGPSMTEIELQESVLTMVNDSIKTVAGMGETLAQMDAEVDLAEVNQAFQDWDGKESMQAETLTIEREAREYITELGADAHPVGANALLGMQLVAHTCANPQDQEMPESMTVISDSAQALLDDHDWGTLSDSPSGPPPLQGLWNAVNEKLGGIGPVAPPEEGALGIDECHPLVILGATILAIAAAIPILTQVIGWMGAITSFLLALSPLFIIVLGLILAILWISVLMALFAAYQAAVGRCFE